MQAHTKGGISTAFQFTTFTKNGGVLPKSITLGPDGRPVSDGSLCAMRTGTARRSGVANVERFAEVINALQPTEALSVGSLKLEYPKSVPIVTIDMHAANPNCCAITRTSEQFRVPAGARFHLS